jgi:signal peptidase I
MTTTTAVRAPITGRNLDSSETSSHRYAATTSHHRRAMRRVAGCFPSGSTQRAIKRIVAVGGDALELTDDALIVNGTRRQISGETRRFERTTIAVPSGSSYLLGDNYAGSIDSRSFGPVPASDIGGCVRTTFPDPRLVGTAVAGVAGVVLLLVLPRKSRKQLGARPRSNAGTLAGGTVPTRRRRHRRRHETEDLEWLR